MQRALLSLHDVTPDTLPQTEKIATYTAACGIPPITLLVVPGVEWQAIHLKRLSKLAEAGHELAAHGWSHAVGQRYGLYHHLHAAVISRNTAEHLALDAGDILALMQRAHDWFTRHRLPAPTLYVPPAWALGGITIKSLQGLPYRQVEVLDGLIEVETGLHHQLPLIGFEADTPLRASALRIWNHLQLRRSRLSSKPVRIALHPNDFNLRLALPLKNILQQSLQCIAYEDATACFQGREGEM